LLLVSWSCVIMQVMTVLASLQGLGLKIERSKTRNYSNCLTFAAGAASRFDHFEEMEVMGQFSQRRSPLAQCHYHFGPAIGPQPGPFDWLIPFPPPGRGRPDLGHGG